MASSYRDHLFDLHRKSVKWFPYVYTVRKCVHATRSTTESIFVIKSSMLLGAIFVSKADHYPPLVSKEVEVSLCLNFGEGSGWGLKEAWGGGGA